MCFQLDPSEWLPQYWHLLLLISLMPLGGIPLISWFQTFISFIFFFVSFLGFYVEILIWWCCNEIISISLLLRVLPNVSFYLFVTSFFFCGHSLSVYHGEIMSIYEIRTMLIIISDKQGQFFFLSISGIVLKEREKCT